MADVTLYPRPALQAAFDRVDPEQTIVIEPLADADLSYLMERSDREVKLVPLPNAHGVRPPKQAPDAPTAKCDTSRWPQQPVTDYTPPPKWSKKEGRHVPVEIKADTDTLLPLDEYDHIIVQFSGGKDSIAAFLHLLDLGRRPAGLIVSGAILSVEKFFDISLRWFWT